MVNDHEQGSWHLNLSVTRLGGQAPTRSYIVSLVYVIHFGTAISLSINAIIYPAAAPENDVQYTIRIAMNKSMLDFPS